MIDSTCETFYLASNDVAFKTLMQKNPESLKKIINFALQLEKDKIETIDFCNTEEVANNLHIITPRYDLLVNINNSYDVDLEMQNTNYSYLPKRLMYYYSSHFLSGIIGKKNEKVDYSKLKPFKIIMFLTKNSKNFSKLYYNFEIYDTINAKEFPGNLLNIVLINLTKIDKPNGITLSEDIKNLLKFFISNREEMKDMSRSSKEIKKLYDELQELNDDPNFRGSCMQATFDAMEMYNQSMIIEEQRKQLAKKDNALVEKDNALAEKTKEIELLKAKLARFQN